MDWLTVEDVARWITGSAGGVLGVPAEAVNDCIAATIAYARRCRYDLIAADGTFAPDAECKQAAIMYAARMIRRRNSISGVEQFGDGGVAYAPRYDPDIDRGFRIGSCQQPLGL